MTQKEQTPLVGGAVTKNTSTANISDTSTENKGKDALIAELLESAQIRVTPGGGLETWFGVGEERPISASLSSIEIMQKAIGGSRNAARKMLAWRAGIFPRQWFPAVHRILYAPETAPEMRTQFKRALAAQYTIVWSAQADPDIGQLTWVGADWNDPEKPKFDQRFIDMIEAYGPWPMKRVTEATLTTGLPSGPEAPVDPFIEEIIGGFKMHKDLASEQPEEIDWLVKDKIPIGQPIIFAGNPHTGKSLNVLGLIRAILTGGTFWGERVQQGRTIYLSLDDDGIVVAQRLRAFGIAESEDGYVYARRFTPELMLALPEVLARIRPTLLVIDTLVKCIWPKEKGAENDPTLMDEIIEGFRRITDSMENPPVTLFVAHVTKYAGTIRGAGSILGAIPTAVMFKKLENPAGGLKAELTIDSKFGPEQKFVVSFKDGHFDEGGAALEPPKEEQRRKALAEAHREVEADVDNWLENATDEDQRTVDAISDGTKHRKDTVRDYLKNSELHYFEEQKNTGRGRPAKQWFKKTITFGKD